MAVTTIIQGASPATVVDAGDGSQRWSNPSLAAGAADGQYASVGPFPFVVNVSSATLQGSNIGFHIPSGSIIKGLSVGVYTSVTDIGGKGNFSVVSTINGVSFGQSGSVNNVTGQTPQFVVLELGGLGVFNTLAGITADQINAGMSCSCAVYVSNAGGASTGIFVESMFVNVWYSIPTPPQLFFGTPV